MLIRTAVLERIVGGEIDTQFRRQKKPTVKAGGTLRTHLGMLEIVDVTQIALDELTDDDARRSGAKEREQVIADLTKKADGDFYRVRLRYAGVDPRLALRADDDLSQADVEVLTAKLDRLDRSATDGPWTRQTLRLIADRPHVRAPDLAGPLARAGCDGPDERRVLVRRPSTAVLGCPRAVGPGRPLQVQLPRPSTREREQLGRLRRHGQREGQRVEHVPPCARVGHRRPRQERAGRLRPKLGRQPQPGDGSIWAMKLPAKDGQMTFTGSPESADLVLQDNGCVTGELPWAVGVRDLPVPEPKKRTVTVTPAALDVASQGG